MATMEQRGRRFRIVYWFQGIRFSHSLKTESPADARALKLRLEDNLRRIELGTLVLPEGVDMTTFLFSDGRLTEKQRPAVSLSLQGAFEQFFAALPEGNIEESTKGLMRSHQKQLVRILGANLALHRLNQDHLQKFVEVRSKEKGLRGRLVSATTIKKAFVTFRVVWNWAVNAGKLQGKLPLVGLRFPKIVEKSPFQTWGEIERRITAGKLTLGQQRDLWDCLFLTLLEIDEVLEFVKASNRFPFVHPMFVFAAHTGARRSEILRSEIGDINFENRVVTIREKKRAKGRITTRRVPLTQKLADVLKQWFALHPGGVHTFSLSDRLGQSFKHREHPSAMTRDEAQYHLRHALDGSKWEVLRGWHVFRHSFCSNLAAKGVDQRLIDAWVGHTTEEMRRRYRHLIPSVEQATLQAVFG